MREACSSKIAEVNGYGPLLFKEELATTAGGKVEVQFVNFLSWMHGAHKAGGSFYQLCESHLGPGPAHVVLYTDEVVPGNPLAASVSRKMWAVYASLKEFKSNLSCESSWVTLALVRSTTVAQVEVRCSKC